MRNARKPNELLTGAILAMSAEQQNSTTDFGSGVYDKNGREIFAGNRVRITINHSYGRPTVREATVAFIRGCFRYVGDDGKEKSPIGSLSFNCETEIVS